MKQLRRSRKNKIIAGVCGGIAEYFDIDPVIVRIIAVALLLPGGLPGFLPYVILWIIVPLEDEPAPNTKV
jgi:phage shock protein C